MDATTTLGDVLAYIVYIIKEVAEGVEQLVGFSIVLSCFGIGDDVDAEVFDVDVDVSTRHDGVTVVVDGSWLVAMDMQALGAEGLDLGVVAQSLHKQVGGNLGRFEGIEGFHDDDIHLAVAHGGTWGDVGVVAVL